MNILVMKFRNIGDVLLITPLLRNLKFNYPHANIDVSVNAQTKDMLTLNPNVRNIIVYERDEIKKLSFFKKLYEELKFVKNIYREKYDMIINLTDGDRGNFLSLLSKSKIKIGYESDKIFFKYIFTHIISNISNRHMIEANLDPIRLLKLKIKDKKVEIFNSLSDDLMVEKIVQNKAFIHIHPVSRWLFKCIDDKIMANIIDFCKFELKKEVILTASSEESELKKVNSILSHCKSKPMNLSGKLTLKQTSALNKKALCFIGVDTAIMHISAANDTPILAFFGPSNVLKWGPWDNSWKKSMYNKKNGVSETNKHIAYQTDWDCVPCEKDGCNSSKISDCLMKFDINMIKLMIKKRINV